MPRQSRYDDDAEAYDGPSKTQQKQASHEQQDLGTELLKLSAAQLDGIGMDERLRDALREHGRMPTREARRRHLQFIGKLIRESDDTLLRRALRDIRAGEARGLAEAERWRDRLLADDAAMSEWIKAHPQATGDLQPLRALVRNARREIAVHQDADPDGVAARGRSRAFRDLFQMLRAVIKATPTTPAPDEKDAED